MRADRLIAAILMMQSRGRVTAREVAAELEVSVATARRDLEALASAGVPVYSQPGRGGGWSLVGGARTDLSGLSSQEAQALFLLAGPAAAVSREAKAALRKLVQALPQTFRDDAEAAAGSTCVDTSRWGVRQRQRPESVEVLQAAVVRRRKVRLSYVNSRNEGSHRLVEPWGLVDKNDLWYLLAGTESGQRTFRLDRISEVAVTDQPASRPDDFGLAEAWERVVTEMEERRSTTWVTVTIDTRFVSILQDHFDRHHEVIGERDGRSTVRVAAPTALDIARNLAGWGSMVQVVDSPPVASHLARIGTELVAMYEAG